MRESELQSTGIPTYLSPRAVATSVPAPRVSVAADRHAPVRRMIDVIGASCLLVALAPLFAAIALAVKRASPGPVFYRQTRVGINRRSGLDRRSPVSLPVAVDRRRVDRRTIACAGRQFRIVKFRTMVEDAEAATGPRWAGKIDSRITAIGRVLRRYRLDELPQLLNVLRGDMTFIGPRPERPFFVERFRRRIPGYGDRLAALPGITGLAQVEHKYDETEEDVRRKLEFDLRYLRERGLRTDLRILGKTVVVVLTGTGAH